MKAEAWDFAAWPKSAFSRVLMLLFFPPEALQGLRRAHYAPCGASRWLALANSFMKTVAGAGDGQKPPLGPAVQIDDERIQAHLDEMVRAAVKETLNAIGGFRCRPCA
jgi:hypothetical protein